MNHPDYEAQIVEARTEATATLTIRRLDKTETTAESTGNSN